MARESLENEKSLETLLFDQTDEFRKFVNRFIKDIKSPESQEIIRGYLEQGRTDLVLKYINDNSNNFNEAILAAFLGGANFEIKSIARQILDKTYTVSFDITYYQTVSELARIQNEFIRNFNTANSLLFARISRDMIGVGYSIDEAVKLIIENYGLTVKQYEAVQSYRQALTNLSNNALQRELRDVKYDKYVRAAIENNKPFTQTEIDRMVAAYRRKSIESRMLTIARTTSKNSLETGRAQAALQADLVLNRFGFEMVKEWRSKRDSKVRYTHQHGNLDGQVVRESDFFVSPSGAKLSYPGDSRAPKKETVNCRCRLLRYVSFIERST